MTSSWVTRGPKAGDNVLTGDRDAGRGADSGVGPRDGAEVEGAPRSPCDPQGGGGGKNPPTHTPWFRTPGSRTSRNISGDEVLSGSAHTGHWVLSIRRDCPEAPPVVVCCGHGKDWRSCFNLRRRGSPFRLEEEKGPGAGLPAARGSPSWARGSSSRAARPQARPEGADVPRGPGQDDRHLPGSPEAFAPALEPLATG